MLFGDQNRVGFCSHSTIKKKLERTIVTQGNEVKEVQVGEASEKSEAYDTTRNWNCRWISSCVVIHRRWRRGMLGRGGGGGTSRVCPRLGNIIPRIIGFMYGTQKSYLEKEQPTLLFYHSIYYTCLVCSFDMTTVQVIEKENSLSAPYLILVNQ